MFRALITFSFKLHNLCSYVMHITNLLAALPVRSFCYQYTEFSQKWHVISYMLSEKRSNLLYCDTKEVSELIVYTQSCNWNCSASKCIVDVPFSLTNINTFFPKVMLLHIYSPVGWLTHEHYETRLLIIRTAACRSQVNMEFMLKDGG